MNLKGWHRGEKCDVAISDLEREILSNYENEEERGLVHTTAWHGRMAQLAALRDDEERREQEQAE